MNKKMLYTLVMGLFVIQFIVPNFNASESTQTNIENQSKKYAIENPSKVQVREAQPTDIVVFEDATLENTVARSLGATVGEITVEDMSRLTSCGTIARISSLSGLEYAVNLTSINIEPSVATGNEPTPLISDLTPLSGLTQLTSIDLPAHEISNIAPLSNLTKLTRINLMANNISDLTPISELTSLNSLVLDYNQISNIENLRKLVNLNSLSLSSNQISDISVVSNFVELEHLNLSTNQISYISSLENVTKLEFLGLSSNRISNISPLSNLRELTILALERNRIEDIAPLSNMLKMEQLFLNNNQIIDIEPLSNMSNLFNLNLNANAIVDISPIPTSKNINATIEDQIANLQTIRVYSTDEIFGAITSIGGEKITFSFGNPNPGMNILIGNVSFTKNGSYNISYGGEIHQQVVVLDHWKTEATTREGKELTDDEVIAKFELMQPEIPFIVDQSAVDYQTPGRYPVEFTTGTVKLNATLIIEDVLPVLELKNPTLTIKLGEKITDYVSRFGITATEFADGDLTHKINVDTSAVNFKEIGNYAVTFEIIDDEGNVVTESGNIIIDEDPIVTPEIEKSEIKVEEKTKDTTTKSEVKSEVKSESSGEKSESVKSEVSVIAMTDENNKLKDTGNNQNLIIITLSIIVIDLLALKKIRANKNL